MTTDRATQPPLRLWLSISIFFLALANQAAAQTRLKWNELPPIPNELGVAGPFVGTSNGALLVGGGANFPLPVWETSKVWHDDIYALTKTDESWSWETVGKLENPIGYGANVSTEEGVVCIGGNDSRQIFSACFLLRWNAESQSVTQTELPELPVPLAYGQACRVGDSIYVAGGQTDANLSSAVQNMWSLDFARAIAGDQVQWEQLPKWPAPPRAFNITVTQNNGFEDCIYIIGGRYQSGDEIVFLDDCWEYNPRRKTWKEKASLPQAVTAGTGINYGQSHILVLSGDNGSLFDRTDELKDDHPGFPKVTFGYHTITDSWTELGESPANQVTTTAVHFADTIVLPTGEIRPRVRSPKVWSIDLQPSSGSFSIIDYVVLALYLSSLIAIGWYFARRTTSTEDYFRASGQIPWWAAGCSIFATMLSSLTFTGVPSKAFAQDWVYAVGNFMIPLVAFLAVFVALPFYRRIDATSAYEYLELRFHSSLRYFASLCFSTFHVFRMAIVMSLTGLALAVATPMTPTQSVVLMGVLSIVYCTLGGVAAVIWTDTLQTFVLLGGAFLAICWMLAGTGTSLADSWDTALSYDKLNMANWHFDASDAQLAFWVVIIGAIAQNTSSYTADQAVVQRYVTTETQNQAGRAIWTNALLAIPATLLFFGIGTSLFLFYRAHPERLDPGITTDQIFPLFIAQELPWGLSGLIVAAVFAAAQSTVSTSMNSVATTLVTDCLKPLTRALSEGAVLRVAQTLTVCLGLGGTVLAISFVDPTIRSLFDQFIKVIGLFMGILGGLFVLGAFFPRSNAFGAWIGSISGSLTMICVWQFTTLNGYIYTAVGIASCVLAGLAGSLLRPRPTNVAHLHI